MDPERPIEKLLRQAAETRRAQAGGSQELHPANRRVLQNEVARKFAPATANPKRRSFFELLMPRLGWAAAVIVGLGLAASLMLPRQNRPQTEMFFAKNDRMAAPAISRPESALKETLSSAAAKPSAPSESPAPGRADVAKSERDKDASNFQLRTESQRRQLALNEPAPPAASAAGAVPEEKQKKELAGNALSAAPPPQTPVGEENLRRYGFAPAESRSAGSAGHAVTGSVAANSTMRLSDENSKARMAYSTAPTTAVPTFPPVAMQQNSTVSADIAKRSPAPIARVTQQFVQATSLNKNAEFTEQSSTAKPILASFKLEQVGREVRITDSDGSVYSGNFQQPETFTYLDSAAAQKAAATNSLEIPSAEHKSALSDSKLQIDMSYPFKVSGTNQSLNQIVTFTGQVLAPTNALSVLGPAGTLNGNRIAPPELNPLPLQNSRISGRVLIGTDKAIEVNAIPSH
jgi:hypothetical protein